MLRCSYKASRVIVSSDPDEHVERIQDYVEMGFRHLVFHAPGPDQAGFMAAYERDVLACLREHAEGISEPTRGMSQLGAVARPS